MIIKTGGGGVDYMGAAYTLPEECKEVAENYFDEMAKAACAVPAADYIIVSPQFMTALARVRQPK